MKNFISFSILLFVFLMGVKVSAQLPDCTLGIGGKDTEVLIQVFQLNEEQKNTMEIWIGELQTQNKLAEDRVKLLFDTHPQSTQEELETLASKYALLKDEMVANAKSYDQKLIGLFNPKQYQRYVELCSEALREPIIPIVIKQTTPARETPE